MTVSPRQGIILPESRKTRDRRNAFHEISAADPGRDPFHPIPADFPLRYRRGGNPGLTVCAPLLLCNADGSDSDEIKEIYHMR